MMNFSIGGGRLDPPARRTAVAGRFFALSLFLALSLDASAAGSRAKKAGAESADAPPVLMSKTGGGNAWSDVKELTAAAELGNPKARAQLGEMLLRGDADHKVTQDKPRALILLEQAARAGEPSAAFRLGMLLDEGDSLPQDHTRARAYFRAAAAGGTGAAFHNIGAAHVQGQGVKRDYTEGLAWLILATKNGASGETEAGLREHLKSMRRTSWITAAETRAVAIEAELAKSPAVSFLPPPDPALAPPPAAATPEPVAKKKRWFGR